MDSLNPVPACPSDDKKAFHFQLCVKPLIALVSALAIGISVLCLNFGYSIVFPHLYYIPIIIMSATFPRHGLWFTVLIAIAYVAIVFVVTGDLALLGPALCRAAFFIIVGAVTVFLTLKRNEAETALSNTRINLASIVNEQTACISRELEQTKKLEKAYRDATDYYDRLMNQSTASIVVWNSGLYITRTNAAFERLVGKPKTELLGRKVSAIISLDEAAARSQSRAVILNHQGKPNEAHQVLWTFSEIYASEQTEPFAVLAIGQEIS